MKSRRRWRWPDGYYHVFNRGSRRLNIFADDRDRANFVRLLAKTALKHAVAVVAYELMDNHYHLELRGSGTTIGRMIRDLEKTHSRQFNRRTGFTGTLFEGRFGSTWLPDLETVAYVSRYIHANCRAKGATPEDYYWSSCRAYLGRARVPDWLDPLPVLDWAGGPEGYARYLKEVPPLKPVKDHPEDEAQAVFIESLESRVRARLSTIPGLEENLSVAMMVCWIAVKAFAIRPRVLARVLGFSSGNCVSVGIARMARYLDERPALKSILSEVLIK